MAPICARAMRIGRSVPKSPRLPETSASGFARRCRRFHCAIDLTVGKGSCFCSVAAAASPSAWSAMPSRAKARGLAPADQFDCGGQAHVPQPVETEIAHRAYRGSRREALFTEDNLRFGPLRAQPSVPRDSRCVAVCSPFCSPVHPAPASSPPRFSAQLLMTTGSDF